MKTFHIQLLPDNFSANYNRNANTTMTIPQNYSLFFSYFLFKFLSFDSCEFMFCIFISSEKLKNISCRIYLVYSEARIESCFVKQLFARCNQSDLKHFYKIRVSLQYRLLNRKVHKFIKNEILESYFSRAIFVAQFQMAAFDHLFKKCDQTIRQVKNHLIIHPALEEKLNQLGR